MTIGLLKTWTPTGMTLLFIIVLYIDDNPYMYLLFDCSITYFILIFTSNT